MILIGEDLVELKFMKVTSYNTYTNGDRPCRVIRSKAKARSPHTLIYAFPVIYNLRPENNTIFTYFS